MQSWREYLQERKTVIEQARTRFLEEIPRIKPPLQRMGVMCPSCHHGELARNHSYYGFGPFYAGVTCLKCGAMGFFQDQGYGPFQLILNSQTFPFVLL